MARQRLYANNAERTAHYLARLKDEGGIRRTITFTGEEAKNIATLRERWGMTSDRDVIARALEEVAKKRQPKPKTA